MQKEPTLRYSSGGLNLNPSDPTKIKSNRPFLHHTMIWIEHAHLQQNLHVRLLFPLDILKASQQPKKIFFQRIP